MIVAIPSPVFNSAECTNDTAVLQGVPGVGKTATAEAIAQFHGKPLFKIACGDLGLTPSEVEGNLRGIFRLAGLWDCILLLDEVDTFFSQRSKGDAAVNKNALVSGTRCTLARRPLLLMICIVADVF